MSADRAALELSKEGQQFLDLVAKCPDSLLASALLAAGARLLTVGASGKENAFPAPTAPDLSSAFLTLKGLTFINPRGRFDLAFSREALYVSNGKTTIVIPMTQLTHVAVLDQIPQDTKKRCLLFLVLDRSGPAVMNGKQRLDVIIIQTLESDTISTKSSGGELLEGPMVAVLCQAVGMCIPNFTNFLAPDPEVYKSTRGLAAVSAVVKVSSGHLFPLPGALLFAERPALFLPHRDVLAVEYRRVQSATFDLVLHTHTHTRGGQGAAGGEDGGDAAGGSGAGGSGGGGSVSLVEFSQIDRNELGRLQSYFAASKIKLFDPAAPPRPGGNPARGGGGAGGSAGAGGAAGGGDVMDLAEDEDDEDEDEDDEDFDPSSLEKRALGRRPAKRARTEPSGSVAASNLPGGAGPSGSRDVAAAAAGSSDEDDEDEEEEEDEDEDESSYDEEDELADLSDEDVLRADDVRQRVRQGSGGGRGGAAAAGGAGGSSGAGGSAGKGAAAARSGRRAAAEEEEEDDDDDDDDEDYEE